MGKRKDAKRRDEKVGVYPIYVAAPASSGCLLTLLTFGLLGRRR